MTTQDLDRIDRELSALDAQGASCAEAKRAALRFNAQLEQERARLKGARATQGRARPIPMKLEIELRAAAVMYGVERERVVRRWNIPLRARVARG